MIRIDYYAGKSYPVEISTPGEKYQRCFFSDDEALELYNELGTIAADIIQRRADEKEKY